MSTGKPLWKIWKSVGIIIPIYGKIKLVQTCSNHQPNKLGLRRRSWFSQGGSWACWLSNDALFSTWTWLRNDESRLWLNPLSNNCQQKSTNLVFFSDESRLWLNPLSTIATKINKSSIFFQWFNYHIKSLSQFINYKYHIWSTLWIYLRNPPPQKKTIDSPSLVDFRLVFSKYIQYIPLLFHLSYPRYT